MNAPELLLAALSVTLGAVVQGVVGFGAGLISIPLLLLIDPTLVPGPVVVVGLTMNVMALGADPRGADWRGARWAMLGLVPGTLVAAAALTVLTGRSLSVLAGAAVLVAVVISALGLRPTIGRRTLLGAGFFSGYLSGTAGVGGPPLAMAYQTAPSRTLRATLPVVFVAGGCLTLFTLARTGHLSAVDWRTGLILAPGSVVGYHLARRRTADLNGDRLRVAVLVVSAVAALAALGRVLL